MNDAPGIAAAHPETVTHLSGNRDNGGKHLTTLDEAVKVIASFFSRADFIPDARTLIAEGAELEYKIIIRARKDGTGLTACLDKYIRTAPIQIAYFGGLK